MPLLPHFGTYNLQQQKASKLKFLLQQKFGFLAIISCQQVILVRNLKISGSIEIPQIDQSKWLCKMPV
jgi:hypothetical protein